jgi:hypothetical protein
MRLIAIDPGNTTGHAVFTNGSLTHAGLGLPDLMADVLVVEKPEWRPGGKTPVNDLITLAFTAGQCASAYAGATLYVFKPSQWKGSVEKAIHHPRILDRLELHELVVSPAVATYSAKLPGLSLPQRRRLALTKVGNTVDAIGLGLFALKRMGRGA